MTIRSLFLLTALSFVIGSCEKADNVETELTTRARALELMQAAATADAPPVKNFIVLKITKKATLPQYPAQDFNSTAVMAGFYDGAGNAVSVGTIYAGSISTSPGANNLYSYASNLVDSSASRQQSGARVMDETGQDITVSADGGNGYSGFSQTVHVPADFNLTASDYNVFIAGRQLRLNWTPDPGNAFGNVLINVVPYPGSGGGPGLAYLVPDNGSYVVPAGSMANFPVNSRFTYSIAKVNEYEVDPVADIMAYAIVETVSDALIVIPSPGIYVRLDVDGTRVSGGRLEKMFEENQTIRFFQDAACTVPLQIWSDITVYIREHYTEGSTIIDSDRKVLVSKGSSALNLGWQPTSYNNLMTGESWRYDYSLPEQVSYNSVN